MNLNELTETVLVLSLGTLAGLVLCGMLTVALRDLVPPHHPALVESLRLRADTPAALFLPHAGAASGFLLIRLVRVLGDHLLAVLPIIHFLENPFTNWTRRTADILVAGHPAWDGRVAEVVVTDALPNTPQLSGGGGETALLEVHRPCGGSGSPARWSPPC